LQAGTAGDGGAETWTARADILAVCTVVTGDGGGGGVGGGGGGSGDDDIATFARHSGNYLKKGIEGSMRQNAQTIRNLRDSTSVEQNRRHFFGLF